MLTVALEELNALGLRGKGQLVQQDLGVRFPKRLDGGYHTRSRNLKELAVAAKQLAYQVGSIEPSISEADLYEEIQAL